jgi:hypothetical protein
MDPHWKAIHTIINKLRQRRVEKKTLNQNADFLLKKKLDETDVILESYY